MTSTDNPSRPGPADRGSMARPWQWIFRTHRRAMPGVALRVLSQLALVYAILHVYSWFRKSFFQRPDELAYANALDIIDLQRRLGIAVTDVEIRLQQWVLDHPALVDVFNAYYQSLKPALLLSAGLCLLLAPGAFGRIRSVFLLATLIAFPWYALYPLAPPRLMERYGFNFIDTLAVFDGTRSSSAGPVGANQFAAMPSMHIGWTAVAALWLTAAIPWRRVGATLGLVHLTLMSITVVVTGNHYILDIVGGVLVAGGAALLAGALSNEWHPPVWSTVIHALVPRPAKGAHSAGTPGSGRQDG